MDVKLGELGTWIGGRDFTPNGIIAAVRRGKKPGPNDATEESIWPVLLFKLLPM